jgi:hypothetical protein
VDNATRTRLRRCERGRCMAEFLFRADYGESGDLT